MLPRAALGLISPATGKKLLPGWWRPSLTVFSSRVCGEKGGGHSEQLEARRIEISNTKWRTHLDSSQSHFDLTDWFLKL